ncbi:zinc finger MYM-type protein 1-like [Capsicum annuum]|uniref:zinc finger MYM-type protein 1-like n=1 Tax=Capsicum annuum TaxID=4072 RepID=UPI001FB05462|nr:zinc finger MYM-type protein 1-like [Capsicum annuum]
MPTLRYKIYHDWLEYSEIEDAAYCLCCYLFQDESIHQGGGEEFSSIGFRSWYKKKRLDTHVGGPNSDHNKAKKKGEDLMRQEQSIQAPFVKPSNQTKLEYRICLQASVDVVRLFLNQGLAFRRHREDESSLNKGNFLEILSCYASRCDRIRDLVLKNAPKSNQLTSYKIQKDIATSCKLETIKAIMEDLNGDYFSLLVDESCDMSRKEQMAIVLRYVDGKGSVVERFIGIVHAHHTSALCLKEAVLTRVGVSKKCLQVEELVLLISNVLNVVGGSFKRMDELRQAQAEKVQEALDMGEIETGKGLNQELRLVRAANAH